MSCSAVVEIDFGAFSLDWLVWELGTAIDKIDMLKMAVFSVLILNYLCFFVLE